MAIQSWALASLDDTKEFLKITDDEDDELIIRLINQASGFMESFTARKLKTRDYSAATETDREDCWYDGDNRKRLFLRQWPVTSVTSPIEVSGASIAVAGVTDYYGSTGYITYTRRGELFYDNGFDTGKQNVRVSYTAGYLTTSPEYYELSLLVMELVSLVQTQKDHMGYKSEKIGNYSYSLQDLKELSAKGDCSIMNPMGLLNRYRRKITG